MKDVLGNHLKDRLFQLVHWLSIIPLLQRTSQESINLERKSYLDCSSDTLCTREEFGRVTYWLQTLRSWKRWTHRKSTQKDSMRKRWYFPKKKENLFFQSQMDESKLSEEIRTWEHRPWYGIDQFKGKVILTFLENQKGLYAPMYSRPTNPTFIFHSSSFIRQPFSHPVARDLNFRRVFKLRVLHNSMCQQAIQRFLSRLCLCLLVEVAACPWAIGLRVFRSIVVEDPILVCEPLAS